MDLEIARKVAVVAGGSRGCGFAIARALAAEGAAVFLSGREQGHVDDAVAAIRAAGGRASGIAADMTHEAGAAQIVATANAAFGPPAILVVNPPSASQKRGFAAAEDEDFREANEIWVMSLVRLARLTLPAMCEAGWGRIVYMGSIGMKVPHLDDPMYAQNVRVAAAGVVKTLSHEYGRHGITANTIATGPFLSGLSLDYMAGGGRGADEMLAQTASGRWGRPEEMGAVVAFLCSGPASFVTGETIRVDSGYTHNLF
jgi:NAD(P)-dependent dehydrogenase (short-subunit alcohol dehydrogenase family)